MVPGGRCFLGTFCFLKSHLKIVDRTMIRVGQIAFKNKRNHIDCGPILPHGSSRSIIRDKSTFLGFAITSGGFVADGISIATAADTRRIFFAFVKGAGIVAIEDLVAIIVLLWSVAAAPS